MILEILKTARAFSYKTALLSAPNCSLPVLSLMSDGKDVSISEGDQPGGLRNISVDAYETNLKATAHKLNEKESLSAWLTILASGFGLISDGCKFIFHARTETN